MTPSKITQIQVTEAMVQMIKAGIGIKVVAKWVLVPYLHDKGLAIIPVTKKGMKRTWYAVTMDQVTSIVRKC